jgi:serine/threonine-protein kinase
MEPHMTALASVLGFDEEAASFRETPERASGLHRIRSCSEALRQATIGGKYRLESLLGEGGNGEVWRAFNEQLEVAVAIKLLPSDLHSAELGARLRTEARAAAKLVHPGIVRVFDAGESEAGEPFIVMELLKGESLADAMDRGPLAPVQAVQLLLPIIEALALAHSRGVVHRDLKPDNIFIAAEGGATQPKLLDFGIAKLTSDARSGTKLTRAGTLLGSPDYMSPEQARGLPDIDHRSDIWSLCVVLYEAVSGQTPFSAPNCPALLRSIVEDAPRPLDAIASVDSILAALVGRGLEKDRERRYSSSFELGQALASWLVKQGVEEDVTGASLSLKWLGRSGGSPLDLEQLAVKPCAELEEGTLVSVVRPELSPSSLPDVERRARRGFRFMPKVAAAMLALGAAGLGGRLLASPTTGPAPVESTAAASAPSARTALPLPSPLAEAPRLESDPPSSSAAASSTKKVAAPKLGGARTDSVRHAAAVTALPAPPRDPSDPSDPKKDLIDPYR